MKTKAMHTSSKSLTIIITLIIATCSVLSCTKDSPADSPADVITRQLSSGTWKVKSVIVDDVDQTALFKNFTLQYGPATYTTTNGIPVWPASGTWKFKDDTAKVITREDGMEITIQSITTTEFIFHLTWTKTTYGGRSSSVSGLHTFTMVQ